jgi:hypothetical protein
MVTNLLLIARVVSRVPGQRIACKLDEKWRELLADEKAYSPRIERALLVGGGTVGPNLLWKASSQRRLSRGLDCS